MRRDSKKRNSATLIRPSKDKTRILFVGILEFNGNDRSLVIKKAQCCYLYEIFFSRNAGICTEVTYFDVNNRRRVCHIVSNIYQVFPSARTRLKRRTRTRADTHTGKRGMTKRFTASVALRNATSITVLP